MIQLIIFIFKEVKGLFLLLLSLLLSASFTLFRPKNPDPLAPPEYYPYFCNDDYWIAQWCFSKQELMAETYWYFLFEELILLALCLFIYFNVNKFKTALLIFLLAQSVDIIDYVLAYQQTWMYLGPISVNLFGEIIDVGPYPLSWNVFKTIIFCLAIVNEVLLLMEQRVGYDKWKSL